MTVLFTQYVTTRGNRQIALLAFESNKKSLSDSLSITELFSVVCFGFKQVNMFPSNLYHPIIIPNKYFLEVKKKHIKTLINKRNNRLK